MSNKESWIQLSADQSREIKDLIGDHRNGAWYRVLPQEQIPGAFSSVLKSKCPLAVVMYSVTATASTVLVCNGLRYDERAQAIDQEPFGLAIVGDQPASQGLYLHHGSWPGRTTPIEHPDCWRRFASSGMADHFPLGQMPPNASGPLSELAQGSHGGALAEMEKHLAPWRRERK
jgi:hypothetical protein